VNVSWGMSHAYLAGAFSHFIILESKNYQRTGVQDAHEKPAVCTATAIVMRERGRRAVGEIGGREGMSVGWRPDNGSGGTVGKAA
jgi:hypothetical protein